MAKSKRQTRADGKSKRAPAPQTEDHGGLARLDALAELLHRHGLSEIEVQREGLYIRLAAGGAPLRLTPLWPLPPLSVTATVIGLAYGALPVEIGFPDASAGVRSSATSCAAPSAGSEL